MAVLERLEGSGVDFTAEAAPAVVPEPQVVRIESTMERQPAEAGDDASQPAQPSGEETEADLAIDSARAVEAGGTWVVSAEVTDRRNIVDTVAVVNPDTGTVLFDLYDNGSHGDEKPNDGVWTYVWDRPQEQPLPAKLRVQAYDVDAQILRADRGDGLEPLAAEVTRAGAQ
jgi:hypothetical protein